MSKVEDALWDADAALRRLKPEQGRIARKNAREAMLKALRKARKALDEEFPLERKPVRRRRKNRKLVKRLDGWEEVSQATFRKLTLAGISKNQFKSAPRPYDLKQYEMRVAERKAKKAPLPSKPTPVLWAPKWIADAMEAGTAVESIVAAVRSPKQRKRIQTLNRLRGGM